ncbi:GL24832 [Drosophila persimilis]|uniref:GL24832 n=1 Tax=Drosophila persimilis TaxID=7234 RepID=B4GS03_DROPE|nr:GL24832 [Drosophila persimilis]
MAVDVDVDVDVDGARQSSTETALIDKELLHLCRLEQFIIICVTCGYHQPDPDHHQDRDHRDLPFRSSQLLLIPLGCFNAQKPWTWTWSDFHLAGSLSAPRLPASIHMNEFSICCMSIVLATAARVLPFRPGT